MSDMSTEQPVVKNSLTYMNFCAEILCDPAARLIRFQYATGPPGWASRCLGSRSSKDATCTTSCCPFQENFLCDCQRSAHVGCSVF